MACLSSTRDSLDGNCLGDISVDGCEVSINIIPEEVAQKMSMHDQDVRALLQHLYHRVPLSTDASFTHIASILRASSPQQLDFPVIYKSARETIEKMFPSGPQPFQHPDCLVEALALAVEYEIKSIQKGLYYSLVTTLDFDVGGTGALDTVASSAETESAVKHPVRLSPEAAQRCTKLMNAIISHFTPILFTPAATPHMACTDVFADTWMGLIIRPALECSGVYKPLEMLERMRAVDWGKEGLCGSCVEEKRAEWREEQEHVWRLVGVWLALGEMCT